MVPGGCDVDGSSEDLLRATRRAGRLDEHSLPPRWDDEVHVADEQDGGVVGSTVGGVVQSHARAVHVVLNQLWVVPVKLHVHTDNPREHRRACRRNVATELMKMLLIVGFVTEACQNQSNAIGA